MKPDEPGTRFFARLRTFDCECPRCGKLLMVGKGRPHDYAYNRVTSVLTCTQQRHRDQTTRLGTHPGCGLKILMGMIAWPIRQGPQHGRPPDQRPNARQLAELRQHARGVWARAKKAKGESVNQIGEPIAEATDLGGSGDTRSGEDEP